MKASLLKIVNPLMFICFLTQLVTAVFLKILIMFIDLGKSLLLLTNLHTYSGYAFGILFLLHIFLNWNWIKSTYFKKKAVAK